MPRKAKSDKPQCRKCGRGDAYEDELFCKRCRAEVLAELESSGYLTPLPPPSPKRSFSQRENIRETKYGKDDWGFLGERD